MQATRWYALKVFYNRYSAIEATLSRDGVQSYIPMRTKLCTLPDDSVVEKRVPAVAMLMFLRCTDEYITHLKRVLYEKASIYTHPGTDVPAIIPDEEMEQFILLTTAKESFFEPYPYNATLLSKTSQRYRIIDGELAGIEGYNLRFCGDRRFIIPLGNLMMLVSTHHIPQYRLQSI